MSNIAAHVQSSIKANNRETEKNDGDGRNIVIQEQLLLDTDDAESENGD